MKQEEGALNQTRTDPPKIPEQLPLIKRSLGIELESRFVDRNNWRNRITNLQQQYIHDVFQSLTPYYSEAFEELKIIQSQAKTIPPIFSLYKPSSDTCYVGTASIENIWKRVAEKLEKFDEKDDLAIFTEIAFAHEVGHCIAFKYLTAENKAWTLYEREMFSDAFAILHIERWMSEDRNTAYQQMLKLRLGGPPDPERPSPADILKLKALSEENHLEQISEGDYLYQAEQALQLLKQLHTSNKPEKIPTSTPEKEDGADD
jgi:hypothetical protein